jgi:hypothetical protein
MGADMINKRCCVQCDNGGAGSLEDARINEEDLRAAWLQAIREWGASGEAFTANRVLARRDEILAG